MDEGRKEHLQMIQGIIDRMAENSFQLKGWTVTLAAALKVFLKGEARPAWLFVPSLPVIAFWLLDLRSRANKTRGAGFSPFAGEVGPALAVAMSPTIIAFYGPVLLAVIILALFLPR